MLAVPIILFFMSLVLGLFWKRGLPSLMITAFAIAVGFDIYIGDWSFLFPLASPSLPKNTVITSRLPTWCGILRVAAR
jgi:hypothetical protein